MTALDSHTRHQAFLGALEDLPSIPGGTAVKCPVCGDHTPPKWQNDKTHLIGGYEVALRSRTAEHPNEQVWLDWQVGEVGRVRQGGHFTEPWVRPPTRYRWAPR